MVPEQPPPPAGAEPEPGGRRYLAGPIEVLESTDSTNRVAAERAASGAPEGLVVRALRQTEGRGRRERRWHSPVGGLWLSVVLRPDRVEGLSLVAGLAAARTVRRFGVEASVRWPNDVYVGDRKVAGILSEGRFAGARVAHAVVGLGLNVNLGAEDFPEELRPIATSLAAQRGAPLDVEAVQEALLEELDGLYARYLDGGFEALRGEVAAACSTLGRRVRVITEGGAVEGLAEALGPDGCLVLEGGREIRSAERVEVLPS